MRAVGLLHHQMPAEATRVVAYFRFQAGTVITELGLHELRRTALNVEFAGTHLQFDVNQLGLVEIDGTGLGTVRTLWLPLDTTR